MKFNKLILLSIMFSVLLLLPSTFAFDESVNETEIINYEENLALSEGPSYYFNSSEVRDGEGTKSDHYRDLTNDRLKSNSNLHFANGEYSFNHNGYEPLYNVNFYGQDASNTIIDGNGCNIINYNGNLYFENITLKNFLFVNIYGDFEAKNSIFTSSNRTDLDSYYDGGIIYAENADVKLTNCIIKDNAAFKGGAVYVENGILEIINCDFINNTALYYGGSIAIHYSSNVLISNSRFTNCKASANAGAGIYLYESGLTLTNSNFTNMQAKLGSAITSLSSNIVLNGIRCENNVADYEGGAIYSMYEIVTLTNSYFVNNTARSGGALFVDSVERSSISANNFIDNKAQEYGGAIYSLFNNIILDNNIYQNNRAKNGNDGYSASSIDLVVRDGNYTLYTTAGEYVGSIPIRYSLVDEGFVTSVKNQGNNGNCWAFSALAVLESCILKAGGNAVDLSENNLKNLITFYSDYGYDKEVNDGGNFKMALAYLSSWLGPVLEQDDLYDANSALSVFIGSAMHVQNALFFKRTGYLDNDEIKKAILKYGAVATSMFYEDYFLTDGIYYYCDDYYSSDHAVTVVGWDDTINIKGRTGAWLVKNSWGPDWGNNGYFYVSYYDETLLEVGKEDGYTLILNDTIAFDKNYQHETIGISTTWTGTAGYKYKNIFYSTDDEYLAGVSTYFSNPADFTIEILVNGVSKHSQSGHISQVGYFTINLDNYVRLNKGDKFEVIVGLISDEGRGFFSLSRANKAIRDANYKPGISYRVSPGGSEYDMNNEGMVACIKAFTFSDIKSNNQLIITGRGNVVDIASIITDESGILINKGSVTFNINGAETVVDVLNGIALLNNVVLGEMNNISSTFNAEGYISSSNSTSFTRTTIVSNDMTTVYGNNDLYSISLSDIFNGNVANRKVVFTLSNGYSFATVSDVDGVAVLPVDLAAGNYVVNISYAGFGSDNADYSVVNSIQVNKKDVNVLFSSDIDKDSVSIVVGAGDFDGDAVVIIDGDNGNYRFVNGKLSFNLSNLAFGLHTVSVLSPDNYNFLNNLYSFNIDVKRTNIRARDVVCYYDQNGFYSVQLVDVDGNLVSGREIVFAVNGDEYRNITDVNGFASIYIDFVGNYEFSVDFNGDDSYIASGNSSNMLVKTTIELGGMSNGNYSAILLDGNGNPLVNSQVKITLNNEDYYVFTNAAGNVSIELNPLSGQHVIGLYNLVTGEYKFHTIDLGIGSTNITLNVSANGEMFDIQASVVDVDGNPVQAGEVNFNINGVNYSENLVNGVAIINVNLDSEVILIDATFNSEFYGSSVDSVSIKRTSLNSDDLTFNYGDVDIYQVTLSDKYGGSVANRKVVFTLSNGYSFATVSDVDGVAVLPVDLAAGNYVVNISYAGFGSDDANYSVVNSIQVNKKQINIKISSQIIGNKAIIQITADNINNDVIVTVDGKSTIRKIENGLMTFELEGLTQGIHNISVESSLNYTLLNNTHLFNVGNNDISTQIVANDLADYYNKNLLYSIQLVDQYGNPLKEMEIVFSIDGKVYLNTTDANGYASIPIKLTHGHYSLSIIFNGTGNYVASQKIVDILIKPTIIVENKVYDSQFDVTLINSEGEFVINREVNICIGGVNYTATTNDEGVASIPLNLPNGRYVVEITNPANGDFITQSIEILNKQVEPGIYDWIVENKDLTMYYGAGKIFTVRVCNDEGKYVSGLKVTFKIKGSTVHAVSNSNGYASVKINLKPGKYKITATYHGKTVTNNIVIKPTLTAKNIKVKKGKSIKFKAKLVNSKGKSLKNKKITFKFKGKTYKVKTNKKGIATLKLKLKLKVGKYSIKTKYGKNSIKNTIKIKR